MLDRAEFCPTFLAVDRGGNEKADGADPRPGLFAFLTRRFGRRQKRVKETHRVEGYVPPHATEIQWHDELEKE